MPELNRYTSPDFDKRLEDGEYLFGVITEIIAKGLRITPRHILQNLDDETVQTLNLRNGIQRDCGVILIHRVYAALFTKNTADIVSWRNKLKALLGWENRKGRWYGKFTRTEEIAVLVPLREGLLDETSLRGLRELIMNSCILFEQSVRIDTTVNPLIQKLNSLKIAIGWLSISEIHAELGRVYEQITQLSQSSDHENSQHLSGVIAILDHAKEFLDSMSGSTTQTSEPESSI